MPRQFLRDDGMRDLTCTMRTVLLSSTASFGKLVLVFYSYMSNSFAINII